jgi:hypothetical protein
MRRLLAKALIGSISITTLLVLGAISPGHLPVMKPIMHGSIYLLSPGIFVGFVIGSGHVHDISFWILTAMLNVCFYWVIVVLALGLYSMLRKRIVHACHL